MRNSIPPCERLALTLRYLATGESFQSLSFQFRVGKTTIGEIVMEVCTVILDTLKEKYLKTPSSEEKHSQQHRGNRWEKSCDPKASIFRISLSRLQKVMKA